MFNISKGLWALGLGAFIGLTACKTGAGKTAKNGEKPRKKDKAEQVVDLPEVKVEDSKPNSFVREIYNPAYTRRNDLIHTSLEVSFDWEKQHLHGKATLLLKPLFFPTDSLRLDAKNFDIHEVSLLLDGGKVPLKFRYEDKENLYIQLDRSYTRQEDYQVFIAYTAKPEERKVGGSAAITEDKGLYFINPLGKDPRKPKQIWTQGETESSSCWFPTIDRPNERCTQDISITVANNYKTLSNGLLKWSKNNPDGTRTDHWVMDKPHAPYLFMMAVGEFAVVKDEWEGMLLEYYVEPKFEKDAKAIFPNTPEMLSFFSRRLGVRYPWQKYSQVVVRDYVSGAMENTTAVIFGDFVQKTSRELIDHNDLNEGIVAHELMHHWFGDLVTCESWANLPLNESFANYSEYLWFEHKYGRDAADHIRHGEIAGYMNQAVLRGNKFPLIRYNYKDKEDMFDAHSYNKGGAILHMLRQYLGDEAFFASLKYYLEKHSFRAAEVHDLRLAFEEITGEDLSWFFDQWFFTAGHPKLNIQRRYDEATKEVVVELEQTQPVKNATVFILPFYIEVHTALDQAPIRQLVWMKAQKQSFRIPSAKKPLWVAVDAERSLLCERREKQSVEEWAYQYRLGKNYFDRHDALSELQSRQDSSALALQTLVKAFNDPFWALRRQAVDALQVKETEALKGQIVEALGLMVRQDKRSQVRSAALERLASIESAKAVTAQAAIHALNQDSSYTVAWAALNALNQADAETALRFAEKLRQSESGMILESVANIFASTKKADYDSFFEEAWQRASNNNVANILDTYLTALLDRKDNQLLLNKMDFFANIALNPNNLDWARYGGMSALKRMLGHFKKEKLEKQEKAVRAKMDEIKEKEKDSRLARIYRNW